MALRYITPELVDCCLSVPEVTVDDFEALGLYDPTAPHAEQRLELLEYLVGLGATTDDLLQYRDGLGGLASVVALRGGPGLTLGEIAQRSNIDEARVLEFIRAAGFPTPRAEDRVFAQGWARMGATLPAADELFGHDAVLQLIRVMGASMARLADAIVSAFLVNVEPDARREDPVGLAVAKANADAVGILPAVVPAMDLLLRQHILAARRSIVDDSEGGYETQELCVGFVDLVGSTSIAETASISDLGSLLTEFEHLVSDSVIEAGGRVVKLIGDEVLYTTSDPRSGCDIALRLTTDLGDHPRLPLGRAGLAAGGVLMRDGDVFGPVVNLAARIVAQAGPGEVLLPMSIADRLGLPKVSLGARQLKGIDAEVELARLLTE